MENKFLKIMGEEIPNKEALAALLLDKIMIEKSAQFLFSKITELEDEERLIVSNEDVTQDELDLLHDRSEKLNRRLKIENKIAADFYKKIKEINN